MAPPSSAHVQLDDVPLTPIQPSFEGEFRQHDGMVTMMIEGVLDYGVSGQPNYILWPDCWTMKIQD